MKRAIAALLALVLALGAVVPTWAEETHCLFWQVTGENGIYTLMEDVRLSEPLEIKDSENWTLNLNGYSITADTAVYKDLGGTITIKGPGHIRIYSMEGNMRVETYTWVNEKGIELYFTTTKSEGNKRMAYTIERDDLGSIVAIREAQTTIDGSKEYTTTITKDADGNVTEKREHTQEKNMGYMRLLEEIVTAFDIKGNVTEIRKSSYSYEGQGFACITVVTDVTGKVLKSTEYFNETIGEDEWIETYTEKDSAGNITSIVKTEYFYDKGIRVTTKTDYWRDRNGKLTNTYTTVTTKEKGKTITEEVQKNAAGQERYRKVMTEENGKKVWEAVGTHTDWKKVTWVGETITSSDGQTITCEVRTQENWDGVVTIDETTKTVDGNRTIETEINKNAAGEVIRITEWVTVNEKEKSTTTATTKDAEGSVILEYERVEVRDGSRLICTEKRTGADSEYTSKTVYDDATETGVSFEKNIREGTSRSEEWKCVQKDGNASVTESVVTTTDLTTGVSTKIKRESEYTYKENTGMCGSVFERPLDIDAHIINFHQTAEGRRTENSSGGELILRMTRESVAEELKAIKLVASGKTLKFLNIGVTENVWDGNGERNITELGTPLAIKIKTETANKDISIYRVHDGQVENLRQMTLENVETAEDGTFYVGDGYVTIFVSKFSAYAIGSNEKSSGNNYGGGTGSASGAKVTSAETLDPGVGVYAVTAVLSLTGMAWVRRKGR